MIEHKSLNLSTDRERFIERPPISKTVVCIGQQQRNQQRALLDNRDLLDSGRNTTYKIVWKNIEINAIEQYGKFHRASAGSDQTLKALSVRG